MCQLETFTYPINLLFYLQDIDEKPVSAAGEYKSEPRRQLSLSDRTVNQGKEALAKAKKNSRHQLRQQSLPDLFQLSVRPNKRASKFQKWQEKALLPL